MEVPSDLVALRRMRGQANYKQMCKGWLEMRWAMYVDAATGNLGLLKELLDVCLEMIRGLVVTCDGFYHGLVCEYAIQQCITHWWASSVKAEVYSELKFQTTALNFIKTAIGAIGQSTLHNAKMHGALIEQMHTNMHWVTNLVAYYRASLEPRQSSAEARKKVVAIDWYAWHIARSLWAGPVLGYYFTTTPQPVWLDAFLKTMRGYLIVFMYVSQRGEGDEPVSLLPCKCVLHMEA